MASLQAKHDTKPAITTPNTPSPATNTPRKTPSATVKPAIAALSRGDLWRRRAQTPSPEETTPFRTRRRGALRVALPSFAHASDGGRKAQRVLEVVEESVDPLRPATATE